MKNTIACTAFLLLFVLAAGTALADGNVVRLHVVANSDADWDQDLKRDVRDRVITELGPAFAEMSQRDVTAWILANEGELLRLATDVLTAAGAPYIAKVKFRVEDYPIRAYGTRLFPGGKYRSVQIILGEGRGRNWWCLLFPPLCLVKGTVIDDPAETQKVSVRFWLWDRLKSIYLKVIGP